MAYFLELISLLAIIATCWADVGTAANQYLPPQKGYNYDKPSVPFPSGINNQQVPYPTTQRPYQPPYQPRPQPPQPQQPTYRPTPTQPPYRPPQQPSYPNPPSGGNGGHHGGDEHDHHHHEPGMPFDFNYAVKDDYYGNDYSHNAVSDGDVTRGEYRILLPDGRTQIVRYTADWKNGFNAQVTYEGTPSYPAQGAGSGIKPQYGAPPQQGGGNQGYQY